MNLWQKAHKKAKTLKNVNTKSGVVVTSLLSVMRGNVR